MIRRLAMLILAILLLAGCGPKEGVVLDKIYKPDLSYWGTEVRCGSNGCRPVNEWHWRPQEWKLILETSDGDVKEKKVNKKIYYKINVGDHYKEQD